MATALLPAMVFVSAGTASALGDPGGKQDVCHQKGNGDYVLINVSVNAVPAHLGHGDVLPDEYGDCP
jgi:hypothetical protein